MEDEKKEELSAPDSGALRWPCPVCWLLCQGGVIGK